MDLEAIRWKQVFFLFPGLLRQLESNTTKTFNLIGGALRQQTHLFHPILHPTRWSVSSSHKQRLGAILIASL